MSLSRPDELPDDPDLLLDELRATHEATVLLLLAVAAVVAFLALAALTTLLTGAPV